MEYLVAILLIVAAIVLLAVVDVVVRKTVLRGTPEEDCLGIGVLYGFTASIFALLLVGLVHTVATEFTRPLLLRLGWGG